MARKSGAMSLLYFSLKPLVLTKSSMVSSIQRIMKNCVVAKAMEAEKRAVLSFSLPLM